MLGCDNEKRADNRAAECHTNQAPFLSAPEHRACCEPKPVERNEQNRLSPRVSGDRFAARVVERQETAFRQFQRAMQRETFRCLKRQNPIRRVQMA